MTIVKNITGEPIHKLWLEENKLEILSKEIITCGFAGSTKIPKLVYLTLLTGLLKRPVSLLIKGSSGVGKSFSLRMGKQFIPQDAYVEFEGMSEKALVYLGLNLKHKHLIIGEAAGMADGAGRTLLRQLLSEGRVKYATVESTNTGLKGSELPVLEGPAGLIMTTTATGIHPEDESRMLSVNMEESPHQIREALIAQAIGLPEGRREIDLTPWFGLYNAIKSGPRETLIPYARKIAEKLPMTHDKVKRDFPQLLSLLSASALLHSWTREKDDEGRVIAGAADYMQVYELVNQPMSEGLAKAVPAHLRSLVEMVEQKTKEPNRDNYDGVSNSLLSEALDRDQSSVSRALKRAIADGYLRNNSPGQGREAKVVLGDRKLPSGSALPSPAELFLEDSQSVSSAKRYW